MTVVQKRAEDLLRIIRDESADTKARKKALYDVQFCEMNEVPADLYINSLRITLESKDESVRLKTVEAINGLSIDDSQKMEGILPDIAGIALSPDQPESLRHKAFIAMTWFTERLAPYVPQLAELYKQGKGKIKSGAETALAFSGAKGLDIVLDEFEKTPGAIARRLSDYATSIPYGSSRLIGFLVHPKAKVAEAACVILGQMGKPGAEKASAILLKIMEDEDRDINLRLEAFLALNMIEHNLPPRTASILAGILKHIPVDPEGATHKCDYPAICLARFGEHALSGILDLLKGSDVSQKLHGLAAMEFLKCDREEVVDLIPVVQELTTDKDRNVGSFASRIIKLYRSQGRLPQI